MTSQVSVMNLRGIAVASDTVLSRTSGGATKTMGNTGKIYEIGAQHNVLILHSGNADINEVPASLYIYEWSRTLAAPLPTLQDYVDSFIKWAGRDAAIHNADSELVIMTSALDEHFSWIVRKVNAALQTMMPRGEREKESTFLKRQAAVIVEQIQYGLDYLLELRKLEGITENSAAQLLVTAEYDLDAWITDYFPNLQITEDAIALLKRSAAVAISRFQELPQDSLLAFVGYGADEPFGGSIRVNCRGMYGGRLHAHVEARFSVDPNDSKSAISHYAQGEAIASFLRGYNWKVYNRFQNLISSKFNDLVNADGEVIDASAIAEEITSEIDNFSHESFVSPLLGTIEAMSLSVLGDFAGSLVGLQATATYSQNGPATVGGLIEVATIDRAGGIQWRRRLGTENNLPA